MTKKHKQISHVFHPIDKDERLFNVASGIEVLKRKEKKR